MEKIAFIGAGSMAEAVFAGLVQTNFIEASKIYVSNKENESRLEEIRKKYGVQGTTNKKEAMKGANIVFLAMKPHDMENALLEIKDFVEEGQLFISVIAGKSTKFIQEVLGIDVPVIRSMPNTSATIGLSATAIAKGLFATEEHLATAEKIFRSIGTVSIVEEEDMHIVTAISGSGPAYMYYVVEAMEKAAIEAGLTEEVAKQLISQTVIGAGNMLQQSDLPASQLRVNVTSPNGTTAAGLQALDDGNVAASIVECVKQAKKRSEELGASS